MNEKKALVLKNELSNLPDVISSTSSQLQSLIDTFNLPRNIIASKEEIQYAWRELPREISRIPNELRNEFIVRMCVATSVGLFDGAINYIWNAVVVNLKNKIRNLGLGMVAQVLNKHFEESNLNELLDSELIDLCYKLELLSQEGYYFLNQCRDIRNNFSIAHPSIALIDDRELINFISRCCKYGLTDDYCLEGININEFIGTIKGSKLNDSQIEVWTSKLINTFPAQRQLLIPMLLGLYCDSSVNESVRLNSLNVCMNLKDDLDSKTISTLVEQHNKYFLKQENDKSTASRKFFEKLGLISALSEAEQHSIIKKACKNLYNAHLEFNNFYNEPPFSERLLELSNSLKIPDTVKDEYVYTVVLCYVGNQYGVCNAAMPDYVKMIKNFSPKEIRIMLNLYKEENMLADRVKYFPNCRKNFISAVQLLDSDSIPSKILPLYEKIISGKL